MANSNNPYKKGSSAHVVFDSMLAIDDGFGIKDLIAEFSSRMENLNIICTNIPGRPKRLISCFLDSGHIVRVGKIFLKTFGRECKKKNTDVEIEFQYDEINNPKYFKKSIQSIFEAAVGKKNKALFSITAPSDILEATNLIQYGSTSLVDNGFVGFNNAISSTIKIVVPDKIIFYQNIFNHVLGLDLPKIACSELPEILYREQTKSISIMDTHPDWIFPNSDSQLRWESIFLEKVDAEIVNSADSKYKISVIIPTYNRKDILIKTLMRLIFSFFRCKTRFSWNIIICDDGSNCDGSWLDDFADKIQSNENISKMGLGSFEIIRHLVNQGVGAARNTATEKVSDSDTDFILSMDDDTYVGPVSIEILCQTMDSLPDAGAVSVDAAIVSKDKEIIYTKFALSANLMLIRYKAFIKIGNWDRKFRTREDFDLSMRLGDAGWKLYCNKKVWQNHHRGKEGGLMANGESEISVSNHLIHQKYPGRFTETANGSLVEK